MSDQGRFDARTAKRSFLGKLKEDSDAAKHSFRTNSWRAELFYEITVGEKEEMVEGALSHVIFRLEENELVKTKWDNF